MACVINSSISNSTTNCYSLSDAGAPPANAVRVDLLCSKPIIRTECLFYNYQLASRFKHQGNGVLDVTAPAGSVYNITYLAYDNTNNTNTVSRLVSLIDTVAPSINIFGSNNVALEFDPNPVPYSVPFNNFDVSCGSTPNYIFSNATSLLGCAVAWDSLDGNVSCSIATTVHLLPPPWPLPCAANFTCVAINTTWVDSSCFTVYYSSMSKNGLNKTISSFLDCRGHVGTTSLINASLPLFAQLQLTFVASDLVGNTATTYRTVTIVDRTPPTLSLLPNTTSVLYYNYFDDVNDTAVLANVTAYDLHDGNIRNIFIVGTPINTVAAGTYNISFMAMDGQNNTVQQILKSAVVAAPTYGLTSNMATVRQVMFFTGLAASTFNQKSIHDLFRTSLLSTARRANNNTLTLPDVSESNFLFLQATSMSQYLLQNLSTNPVLLRGARDAPAQDGTVVSYVLELNCSEAGTVQTFLSTHATLILFDLASRNASIFANAQLTFNSSFSDSSLCIIPPAAVTAQSTAWAAAPVVVVVAILAVLLVIIYRRRMKAWEKSVTSPITDFINTPVVSPQVDFTVPLDTFGKKVYVLLKNGYAIIVSDEPEPQPLLQESSTDRNSMPPIPTTPAEPIPIVKTARPAPSIPEEEEPVVQETPYVKRPAPAVPVEEMPIKRAAPLPPPPEPEFVPEPAYVKRPLPPPPQEEAVPEPAYIKRALPPPPQEEEIPEPPKTLFIETEEEFYDSGTVTTRVGFAVHSEVIKPEPVLPPKPVEPAYMKRPITPPEPEFVPEPAYVKRPLPPPPVEEIPLEPAYVKRPLPPPPEEEVPVVIEPPKPLFIESADDFYDSGTKVREGFAAHNEIKKPEPEPEPVAPPPPTKVTEPTYVKRPLPPPPVEEAVVVEPAYVKRPLPAIPVEEPVAVVEPPKPVFIESEEDFYDSGTAVREGFAVHNETKKPEPIPEVEPTFEREPSPLATSSAFAPVSAPIFVESEDNFYDSGTAVRAGFAVHDRSDRSEALKAIQDEVYEATGVVKESFTKDVPSVNVNDTPDFEAAAAEEEDDTNASWIHGKMSMKDADKILREGGAVGAFLFRRKDASSAMPLALSVFTGSKSEHFLVEFDGEGLLVINRTKLQADCRTLKALIAHLTTTADVIPVPLSVCSPAM